MLYSIPIRAILGERRIELENTITNSIDFNGFSRQAHTNCVVPKPIVNDPLYLITRPMYLNSSKFRNYTRQLIFKTYRLQQTSHPHMYAPFQTRNLFVNHHHASRNSLANPHTHSSRARLLYVYIEKSRYVAKENRRPIPAHPL